jgi:polar amino acid transport system substrate-binding protein
MTRWSRLLCLLAVLGAAALVAAACGDDEEDGGAPTGAAQEQPEYRLVREGRLTIGSDLPYPPFEFEKAGELTGFDVELIQAIAERLGVENEASDWISADWGTIFQQLAAGRKFDMVVGAATAYAPKGSPAADVVAERRNVVDFTVPYYDSLQSLAVDAEANPQIKSVDDLESGDRVAIQRATTGGFWAEENLKPKGIKLVSFEKAPPMFQALQARQVVGVVNDLPASLGAIEGKPNLKIVQEVDTGEQYGFAISKENPGLLKAADAALREMYDDGTYATIFKKYFPEQPLPDFASS